MMKLLLIALSACALTARPADLVHPGPVYCHAVNLDVWACRDANGWPWRCEVHSGIWRCEAFHTKAPNADVPLLIP